MYIFSCSILSYLILAISLSMASTAALSPNDSLVASKSVIRRALFADSKGPSPAGVSLLKGNESEGSSENDEQEPVEVSPKTALQAYLREVLNGHQYEVLKSASDEVLVERYKMYLLTRYFSTGACKAQLSIAQSLTLKELKLCQTWKIRLKDLQTDMTVVLQNHPHFNSPTIFKGLQGPRTETTPIKRVVASRKRKRFCEEEDELTVYSSQELQKNWEKQRAALQSAQRFEKARLQKDLQEAAELTRRQQTKTRSSYWTLNRNTDPHLQFKDMVAWMQRRDTNLTKEMIQNYFLTYIVHSYKTVVIDDINFLYHINFPDQLAHVDTKSRTNRKRMLKGMNPCYINAEGEEKSYHWHHLTYDQLGYQSYCVLVTQETHELEGLHPKHLTRGVNRDVFSELKQQANKAIVASLTT
jgi:hypothetical protein